MSECIHAYIHHKKYESLYHEYTWHNYKSCFVFTLSQWSAISNILGGMYTDIWSNYFTVRLTPRTKDSNENGYQVHVVIVQSAFYA